MHLTKRQTEIYNYLKKYIQDFGYSPTFEEIKQKFGLNSKGTVYKHLRNLQEKGMIMKDWNKQRSIEIISEEISTSNVQLPLLGIVKAGQPVEVYAQPDQINVPADFVTHGRHYVLRVSGDSMIDEQIRDGDFVVVKEQHTAYNGQTVVALVHFTEVTLKKYYREAKHIRLQPANPRLKPIFLSPDEVDIQGVVVGVMRKY